MYAPAAHNGRKHILCDIMYEAKAEYIMEHKVCKRRTVLSKYSTSNANPLKDATYENRPSQNIMFYHLWNSKPPKSLHFLKALI